MQNTNKRTVLAYLKQKRQGRMSLEALKIFISSEQDSVGLGSLLEDLKREDLIKLEGEVCIITSKGYKYLSQTS